MPTTSTKYGEHVISLLVLLVFFYMNAYCVAGNVSTREMRRSSVDGAVLLECGSDFVQHVQSHLSVVWKRNESTVVFNTSHVSAYVIVIFILCILGVCNLFIIVNIYIFSTVHIITGDILRVYKKLN